MLAEFMTQWDDIADVHHSPSLWTCRQVDSQAVVDGPSVTANLVDN
jgi:ABC-type Fe2+-enterobactin transport system substrate-binding protein